MFCKSGILIFIFAENNYSIYAHIMLIKTPLLYQSFGPVSCFLSLSLSLFQADPLEHNGPLCSLSCRASKTVSKRRSAPSPDREGT